MQQSVENRKYFEDLRQAAARLAGLLVLAARVIPVHENHLKDHFSSRLTAAGLRIVELAVADGESSRV